MGKKSQLARTLDYWTRQVRRAVILLIAGVAVIIVVYVIIWLVMQLLELLGI